MSAAYYILQPDGTPVGPVPHAQIVAYLQQGVLRPESLVRRADLSEFFAVESYPEFARAPVLKARPTPVAARPAVAKPRQDPTSGISGWMWLMMAVWLVLLGWGGMVGWEKWSASASEKQLAAAEAWKSENLPRYEVTSVSKRFGKARPGEDVEIIIEGTVEEKETKKHPEYGRAERSQVFVHLALKSEFSGTISKVQIKPETVRIRDGKGTFTIIHMVPMSFVEALAPEWESIKVSTEIKYEK